MATGIKTLNRRIGVDDSVLRIEVACTVLLEVLREGELVPLAALNRKANTVVPVIEIGVRRVIKVRGVEGTMGRQILKTRWKVILRSPPPVCGIEPDPVLLDGPTHTDTISPLYPTWSSMSCWWYSCSPSTRS